LCDICVADFAELLYHYDMSGSTTGGLPKHRQVYNALRAEIAAGSFRSGQRLPSEADLVKTFGASRITIGRALRDLQQEGLIERRAGSGTYVRRAHPHVGPARAAFGLLIPDLVETEILEPIVRSLTGAPAAREHAFLSPGGALDLSPAEKEDAAWERCAQYIERRVAGVFFAPLELTPNKDRVNERISGALEAAGIPVVLLDRPTLPYGQREHHDLVGIDNRRAGYQITEHLVRAGARRIAFVNLANAASTVDARRAGYREALHAAGRLTDPALTVEFDPSDMTPIAGLLHDNPPDGIVCANDRTAGLVMHTVLGLGLAIPADVRIVGIDDVHYASLLPVPLTTLRQPCREIGMAAMAAMLERVTRPELPPRQILLHTPLIVRQSCGAGEPARLGRS
jgi:GntR family transcriptional regulator, arabinose operon transcriptional repressor